MIPAMYNNESEFREFVTYLCKGYAGTHSNGDLNTVVQPLVDYLRQRDIRCRFIHLSGRPDVYAIMFGNGSLLIPAGNLIGGGFMRQWHWLSKDELLRVWRAFKNLQTQSHAKKIGKPN